MEPFSIKLSNGATLTGLSCFPAKTSATPPYAPLLVGLHGGTYSSRYFNATPSTSASAPSKALGLPFLAINRPGYLDSTAKPPTPEDSSFHREEGKYLHSFILPAIWSQFAKNNGCATLVLLAHSMGAPGAIVAGALHASEKAKPYPYGGLIISGWGTSPPQMPKDRINAIIAAKPPRIHFPTEAKDYLMLGPKDSGRADPAIYDLTEELDTGMTFEEFHDGQLMWLGYWKDYVGKVEVPVMYGLSENDALWAGKGEYVEEFARAFSGSRRVERGLILGAPHCLELSRWAKGWYLRSFGFAVECATAEMVG